MTELSQEPDKKVALITSFSCPSCSSGSEKYSELFDHGACKSCGSPLEQFSATLTETGEKEIKSSVLLLYSKEDVSELGQSVILELKQNGINVVDANDIIDGSKTSVVSANLAYVMYATAGVLVIPSAHLEDDPVMSTCLGNALIQKVEKSKKLIPIYIVENISGKVPFGLGDTAGINWDGKVEDNRRALPKDGAFKYIQKFVAENASK